jgi:DNA-binding transcriptional LysR family regulator
MHKSKPEINLTAAQLRSVLAVADHRSFVAAAWSLKLSQPSLTRTVKRVEDFLGVKLFIRTTRQLSLTAAGHEFATLARRVLNDLKLGVDSVRMLEGEKHSQVLVSSVVPLTHPTLAFDLVHYSQHHPGVEIHLRQGLQSQIVDDVRAGAVDFAIGYLEDLPASIIAEDIRREHFYVVSQRRHPLPDRRVIELRALKDEPLVSFPPESHTRWVVDGAARSMKLTLRHAITVNQRAGLLELVRHGAGIAIVPGGDCPVPEDADFAIRLLAHKRLSCRLGVMYLRDRPASEAALALRELLKECVQEQPRPTPVAQAQPRDRSAG